MFKSGIIIMIITMISRILGLVRGTLIAYYFGASSLTDAYFSAFKVTNFFRQLLGEGALGNTFIPIYNERIEKIGEEKSKQLIFSILNLLFIFSTIISLIMFIFSKQIIGGIVNGFSPETQKLATKLLQVMSIYFVFISLSGMISAILNNFKKFIIPASTSIFFNLAIIIMAKYYSKTVGVNALAYGVVIGGILQFVVVLPQFFKIVKTYSFRIDFKDEYLKKIFIMMLPMLLGIVARQVNSIVDQMFASHLESGGVSALENATRLYLLPVGVFGISISTVVFPTLAKATAQNNFELVKNSLIKGLNILLFLIVPSTIVLTFYAKDVVKLTLSYGKFGEKAVFMTSGALIFYSLGLYFYTAIHLMTRAFYSMKDTKLPVRFSIISICVNIILNFALIKSMKYNGLALSTSIAGGVNFLLLLFVFKKKYINFSLKQVFTFFVKVILAGILALLVSNFINNIILKLVVFSCVYLFCLGKTLMILIRERNR